MQTEKLLLSYPKVELYIPETPLKSIHEHDFNSPSRNFIVQGETLEFYLIIHLGDSKDARPPTNTPQTFESDSEGEKGAESAGEEEQVLGEEEAQKIPQFREQLRRLFTNLEVRTEFMRTNSKWKPSSFGTSINSMLSKTSPVSSEDQTNVFVRDREREMIHRGDEEHEGRGNTASPMILLPNGDIVYPLETDVSIKKRHINHHVLLTAVLLPVAPEIQISELISPSYIERRSAMRVVTCPVKVVQPLAVEFDKHIIGNTLFVTLMLENDHSNPMELKQADVNVVETREAARGKESINYRDFFNIHFDTEDFPVILLPGERYNFVVSLDPLPASFTKNDHLNSTPEVHLTWRTPSLGGCMISPYRIPSPPMPSKKKLLISFDVENSPVKVNTLFPVHITVSNLSARQARDISMEIPLPEMEMDQEPVVRTVKGATKAVSGGTTHAMSPEKFLREPTSKTSELLFKLTTSNTPTPLINTAGTNRSSSESAVASLALGGTTIISAVPPTASATPSLANQKLPTLNTSTNANTISETQPTFSNIAANSPVSTLGIYQTISNLNDYTISKSKEIGLACLQKVVQIGTVEPKGKVLTTLQCIALREGLFTLRDIKIIDRKNSLVYVVQQPCEIFAVK